MGISELSPLLFVAAVVLMVASCQRETFPVVKEADRVVQWTTPTGALLVARKAFEETTMGQRQQWEVTSTQSWNEYVTAVTQALEPLYRCVHSAKLRAACTRKLSGDLLSVALVARSTAPGVVVSVTFETHPD